MNSERGMLLGYRPMLALSLLGLFGLNAFSAPPVSDAEVFLLRDYLGRSWENERVTFPLTKAQLAQAGAGHALAGGNGIKVQSAAGTDYVFLSPAMGFAVRERRGNP